MQPSLKMLRYMLRCKKAGAFVTKQDLSARFPESVISELCFYDYLEPVGTDGLQITFLGEALYHEKCGAFCNLVISLTTLAVSILGVVLQLLLSR